jgi:hypothetical protein
LVVVEVTFTVDVEGFAVESLIVAVDVTLGDMAAVVATTGP